MKFNTNFAKTAGRMLPFLTIGFLLLGAVVLFISLLLFFSASHISSDLPELEERFARYKNREILKPAVLLSNDKLSELRTRVKNVNDLSNASIQTLPQLFARLEMLMPDGVWLVTLQYRSRENETRLVAESNFGEHLSEFMRRLESSGLYSKVLLTRQTQRTEGSQSAIQFEIQLKGKS